MVTRSYVPSIFTLIYTCTRLILNTPFFCLPFLKALGYLAKNSTIVTS